MTAATAPVTALARLRLTGFVRTGRALAPLLTALVVLGVIYGGGAAQAGEAYGFSAAVLFPVLAWQTQILLNVEPDVQRRMSTVAVGGLRREMAAGLVAASVAAVGLVALALVVPWLIGGVTGPGAGDPPLVHGVVAGVWAHLLLVPPALVLGGLASRAAAGNAARGVAVLAAGAVLAFVFGVKGSPVPWLMPPVLSTSRSTVDGLAPLAMTVHTGQALLWSLVALGGYALLRRRNT